MTTEKKRLIIIDSNSIIHRAYHALPPLTTKKGELVNAVYGFLLVFLKIIKDFHPDYIVAAFDFPAPTFRHKKYKEYKAKRPPTPDDLRQQIPKVKEVLKSFNVPIFEKEGYEADDIIATIKFKSQTLKVKTIIISGDSDLLQLIDKKTEVYILKKGIKDAVVYNENLVKEQFLGLRPQQLLDFKALKGDPSDNIPGVPGIGEKTAIKLIKEFGSLENLYSALNQQPLSKEKLINLNQRLLSLLKQYKEQSFLSKNLSKTKKNTPINFDIKKCQWGKFDKEKVIQTLKTMEFFSLIEKLPNSDYQKQEKIQGSLKLW